MSSHSVTDAVLSSEQLSFYEEQGFLIVPGLFAADEVDAIRSRFDDLAAAGRPVEGYWEPKPEAAAAGDVLGRYPRVMQPHRWDPLSRRILLDRRLGAVLRSLLGQEPVAAQTMYYFKPPGARGQAFHQDNFYLEVKPGSCIAAWIAIDRACPENGGLVLAAGTHRMPVVCPELADQEQSFTTHLVKPPPGARMVPADLAPGDVLFFNGSLIHGSPPNTSASQWRRSLICHYLPRDSRQISRYYFPLLDFDGREVAYEAAPAGGPCGNDFKPSSYSKWH